MVATDHHEWELPPIERTPLRQGLGTALRVGALWPECSSDDFDIGDVEAHESLARQVERTGLDFVLVADERRRRGGRPNAGLRSMLWSVPVITATSTLGVVTSMRTTFLHPTQIARFGAHLDWLAHGRWGWSVVAGGNDAMAGLHAVGSCPDLASRYSLAEEAVSAVMAVWNAPHHDVSFDSANYRIHGRVKRPTVLQRPRPFLMGSGQSHHGRVLAARCLDAWVTDLVDVEALVGAARDLVGERAPASPPVRIVQHLHAVVRDTGAEAELWLPMAGCSLVEHVTALAAGATVGGVLIEFDEWTRTAVETLGRDLHRLTARGVLEGAQTPRDTW